MSNKKVYNIVDLFQLGGSIFRPQDPGRGFNPGKVPQFPTIGPAIQPLQIGSGLKELGAVLQGVSDRQRQFQLQEMSIAGRLAEGQQRVQLLRERFAQDLQKSVLTQLSSYSKQLDTLRGSNMFNLDPTKPRQLEAIERATQGLAQAQNQVIELMKDPSNPNLTYQANKIMNDAMNQMNSTEIQQLRVYDAKYNNLLNTLMKSHEENPGSVDLLAFRDNMTRNYDAFMKGEKQNLSNNLFDPTLYIMDMKEGSKIYNQILYDAERNARAKYQKEVGNRALTTEKTPNAPTNQQILTGYIIDEINKQMGKYTNNRDFMGYLRNTNANIEMDERGNPINFGPPNPDQMLTSLYGDALEQMKTNDGILLQEKNFKDARKEEAAAIVRTLAAKGLTGNDVAIMEIANLMKGASGESITTLLNDKNLAKTIERFGLQSTINFNDESAIQDLTADEIRAGSQKLWDKYGNEGSWFGMDKPIETTETPTTTSNTKEGETKTEETGDESKEATKGKVGAFGALTEKVGEFVKDVFGDAAPVKRLDKDRSKKKDLIKDIKDKKGINMSEYYPEIENTRSTEAVEIVQDLMNESGINVTIDGGERVDVGLIGPKMIDALSDLPKEFNTQDTTITSIYRTPEVNKKVGGVDNSDHLEGNAMDLRYSPKLDQWLDSDNGSVWLDKHGLKKVTHGEGNNLHIHLELK